MILLCTCKNEPQDRLHGKGKRVHNPVPPKSGQAQERWRCTVCKAERAR